MRTSNAEGLCDTSRVVAVGSGRGSAFVILNNKDYRLLGHVTGNGRREILLYVREPDAVIAKLKGILSQIGEASGELFKSYDPNWEYYLQFPR